MELNKQLYVVTFMSKHWHSTDKLGKVHETTQPSADTSTYQNQIKHSYSLTDIFKTVTNQLRILCRQPSEVVQPDVNFFGKFCQVEGIIRHLESIDIIIQFVQLSKNFKWYLHVMIPVHTLRQKYKQWYYSVTLWMILCSRF